MPESTDTAAFRGHATAPASSIQANALQSAIFNSAMFSKIATDAGGVIQLFNVGAENMLGYKAAEVVNRVTPADIADPHELIALAKALGREFGMPIHPGFEALVFKASRGIEDICELTYVRKDGSRFPAVVSVTALRDPRDAVIGYLLISADNTARKQAERERQDLNAELSRAKLLAENANLAKSEFLSNMSHELRSPLNAILGFAQLIDSGAPAPTSSQKESVEQILQSGWYLLDLINEILQLSLIESGKLSLSPEAMSLSEVLADCHAMIEPQARKSGIRLLFPRFASPCFIKADRTRVKQVLINLLSNAIKYNRVGGTVEVSCGIEAAGKLRLSFRDTGAGLASEKLVQLFQPFNRLGQEAGAQEGTGIGLVVSKRLVELMGGSIGVTSRVGVGSVFWIELIAVEAPEMAFEMAFGAVDSRAMGLHAPMHGVSVHTLLCVEDNPANLMLIERLIARRPGIRLLTARDATRGIEMARSRQPDAILMDINLPGISGLAALAVLADDPATAAIPVIALSANAMPRDIEKGLQAGFFRYLTKPIRVDEFMETLDMALKLPRASSTPNATGPAA